MPRRRATGSSLEAPTEPTAAQRRLVLREALGYRPEADRRHGPAVAMCADRRPPPSIRRAPHHGPDRRGLVVHPAWWDGRIAGADQGLRCGCSINITRGLYATPCPPRHRIRPRRTRAISVGYGPTRRSHQPAAFLDIVHCIQVTPELGDLLANLSPDCRMAAARSSVSGSA